MKRSLFLAICLAVGFAAQAQTKTGGITSAMLNEIQQAHAAQPLNRALVNAVAANSIDALAVNHQQAGALDTYFSVETPKQSITDQQSSGRCWMFSGLNVLRANYMLRHDSLQLELSQAYLFVWDQLEKANLMLQGCVDTAKKPLDDQRVQFFFKSPIGDGGTFCGVSDLAEKYGLVPAEVMPESFSSDNTSKMRALIASKLREYGLQLREMVAKGQKQAAIDQAKTRMLSQIYQMITMTIGEPPQQFSYAFKDKNGRPVGPAKTYTPQSFYEEVVGGPINGTFIMVMNDPRREYYKTYEVEYDRHTYDGHNWKYVNLPMDDIEQLAIASLKDGHKLYSSYDVGKFLDRKRGYADIENFDYASLFGTTFGMDKAQRISTFDSGSTHAMTLTAVDLDADGKATKWKVENSWGASWGQQGCLIMSDRWFREFMFRLVVDKKYVPENILKAAETKPVMVMPEDPLFLPDSSEPGHVLDGLVEPSVFTVVYATSDDGFLNVRREPSMKAPVLTKLMMMFHGLGNGVLLGDGEKWSLVSVGGIVGWVYKKYLGYQTWFEGHGHPILVAAKEATPLYGENYADEGDLPVFYTVKKGTILGDTFDVEGEYYVLKTGHDYLFIKQTDAEIRQPEEE